MNSVNNQKFELELRLSGNSDFTGQPDAQGPELEGAVIRLRKLNAEEWRRYTDLRLFIGCMFKKAVEDSAEAPLDYVREAEAALIKLVLGGAAVGKEFIDSLSLRQRRLILSLQEALNGAETA